MLSFVINLNLKKKKKKKKKRGAIPHSLVTAHPTAARVGHRATAANTLCPREPALRARPFVGGLQTPGPLPQDRWCRTAAADADVHTAVASWPVAVRAVDGPERRAPALASAAARPHAHDRRLALAACPPAPRRWLARPPTSGFGVRSHTASLLTPSPRAVVFYTTTTASTLKLKTEINRSARPGLVQQWPPSLCHSSDALSFPSFRSPPVTQFLAANQVQYEEVDLSMLPERREVMTAISKCAAAALGAAVVAPRPHPRSPRAAPRQYEGAASAARGRDLPGQLRRFAGAGGCGGFGADAPRRAPPAVTTQRGRGLHAGTAPAHNVTGRGRAGCAADGGSWARLRGGRRRGRGTAGRAAGATAAAPADAAAAAAPPAVTRTHCGVAAMH